MCGLMFSSTNSWGKKTASEIDYTLQQRVLVLVRALLLVDTRGNCVLTITKVSVHRLQWQRKSPLLRRFGGTWIEYNSFFFVLHCIRLADWWHTRGSTYKRVKYFRPLFILAAVNLSQCKASVGVYWWTVSYTRCCWWHSSVHRARQRLS